LEGGFGFAVMLLSLSFWLDFDSFSVIGIINYFFIYLEKLYIFSQMGRVDPLNLNGFVGRVE
jgi:hypothetical protein